MSQSLPPGGSAGASGARNYPGEEEAWHLSRPCISFSLSMHVLVRAHASL